MADIRLIPLTLNTNNGGPINRSIQRVYPSGGNGGEPTDNRNYVCTHTNGSYYSGGGVTDYYWTCTNDYNGGATQSPDIRAVTTY